MSGLCHYARVWRDFTMDGWVFASFPMLFPRVHKSSSILPDPLADSCSCQPSQVKAAGGGDPVSSLEVCHLPRPFIHPSHRHHFHFLHHAQERTRHLETYYQPQATQPVCSPEVVSNGDAQVSHLFSGSSGVGLLHRSEGCLPSHSDVA